MKLTSSYLATGLFASAIATTFIAKPASAVSLTSLLTGSTITSSGISFSDFTFAASSLGGAVPVVADSVQVNPIPGGLSFSFALFAGSNQTNDLSMGYRATASSGTLNTVTLTQVAANAGTGVGSVGEIVFSGAGPTASGAVSSFIGIPSVPIPFASADSIRVVKDVDVAGGTNGFASVSVVEQTFPNASLVPEPSEVIGTLAFGTLGAGYLLKRQFKKATV